MKYTVKFTARFKREFKQAKRRGLDTEKLLKIIDLIAEGTNQEMLCREYDDHALTSNWKGYRECHIESDWLLVYELIDDILVLSLARTGTHSDIFKK